MFIRVIGWLYLALFGIGLFDRHFYYVLTLPILTVLIYLVIGLASLIFAHKAGLKWMSVFGLALGIFLLAWGVAGTLYPGLFSPAPLPLDNALHMLTGLWAFYGFLNGLWHKLGRDTISSKEGKS